MGKKSDLAVDVFCIGLGMIMVVFRPAFFFFSALSHWLCWVVLIAILKGESEYPHLGYYVAMLAMLIGSNIHLAKETQLFIGKCNEFREWLKNGKQRP